MKNEGYRSPEFQAFPLEMRYQQLQERLTGLEFVVGWLMAHACPDEALRFLADQATEMEPSGRHGEYVALLDELSEDVVSWLDQQHADPPAPR